MLMDDLVLTRTKSIRSCQPCATTAWNAAIARDVADCSQNRPDGVSATGACPQFA